MALDEPDSMSDSESFDTQ